MEEGACPDGGHQEAPLGPCRGCLELVLEGGDVMGFDSEIGDAGGGAQRLRRRSAVQAVPRQREGSRVHFRGIENRALGPGGRGLRAEPLSLGKSLGAGDNG